MRIPKSINLDALMSAVRGSKEKLVRTPIEGMSRPYGIQTMWNAGDNADLTAFHSPTPMIDIDLALPGDVHGIKELRDTNPQGYKNLQARGLYPELGDALDRLERYEQDSGRTLLKKLTPGGLHVDDLSNPTTNLEAFQDSIDEAGSPKAHWLRLPPDVRSMADRSYVHFSDQLGTFPRRVSMKVKRPNDFVEAHLLPLEMNRAGLNPKRVESERMLRSLIEIVNQGQQADPREALSQAASTLDPKRAALIRALHKLSVAGAAGAGSLAGFENESSEETR